MTTTNDRRSPHDLRPEQNAAVTAARESLVQAGFDAVRIMDLGDGWERVEILLEGGQAALCIQPPDPDEDYVDGAWSFGLCPVTSDGEDDHEVDTEAGRFDLLEVPSPDAIGALAERYLRDQGR